MTKVLEGLGGEAPAAGARAAQTAWQPEELAYQLAQGQRHAFMNQIQVVLGWLQLGDSRRALASIEEIARQSRKEGALLQQFPENLVPWLWTWVNLARQRGVKVKLQVAAVIDGEQGAALAALPALPALRYCLGELLPLPSSQGVPALTLRWAPAGLQLVYSNLGDGAASLYESLRQHPQLVPWLQQRDLRINRNYHSVTVNWPAGRGRSPG